MDGCIFSGGINILLGLFLAVIVLPFLWDKIPMNGWYGVRMPQSFRSEQAWYDINRYGARQLIWWSLALSASGLALIGLGYLGWVRNDIPRLILALVPLAVFPTIALVAIVKFAIKYDKQHQGR